MGFSRQECWSGLPFPSPGGLADSEIKPMSPALKADSLPTELQGKPMQVGGGSGRGQRGKRERERFRKKSALPEFTKLEFSAGQVREGKQMPSKEILGKSNK